MMLVVLSKIALRSGASGSTPYVVLLMRRLTDASKTGPLGDFFQRQNNNFDGKSKFMFVLEPLPTTTSLQDWAHFTVAANGCQLSCPLTDLSNNCPYGLVRTTNSPSTIVLKSPVSVPSPIAYDDVHPTDNTGNWSGLLRKLVWPKVVDCFGTPVPPSSFSRAMQPGAPLAITASVKSFFIIDNTRGNSITRTWQMESVRLLMPIGEFVDQSVVTSDESDWLLNM
ncbi:hypothetical protein DFS34DRAFT_598580 [Phlyctochytrium arcticum]|nr:hypothetical protein DFS34DRAFT_598580 [Phlyctochytrium arcticum]